MPDSLGSLLAASEANRPATWAAFLTEYSPLLLHVARSQGGDHDAVMDRYLSLVEALQDRDCRRLRAYSTDAGGKFTTWLLVVARRICFDHHRARYGRPQSDSAAAAARHFERRQLVDLLGGDVGLDGIEVPAGDDPEADCRRRELRGLLSRALASLPAADRLVLKLRFEDDHSVPQVARLVGDESAFAMYRRIDRLLARIRTLLRKTGVEDGVP